MADTTDPKFIDKRTAERYIRGGQLDEKAWDKHLKGLPDVAEKSAIVETRMSDDIDDEEYDDEDEGDEEADEAEESPEGGAQE